MNYLVIFFIGFTLNILLSFSIFSKTFKLNFLELKRSHINLIIIFSLITGILFTLTYLKGFEENVLLGFNQKVFYLIICLFIILCFIYLALYDFFYYEVPNRFSIFLVLFFIIINFISILSSGLNNSLQLQTNYLFNPFSNLLAGFLYFSLFLITVLITKGKGMGGGDIRIALLTGLILGLEKTFLSFYITIFSALIFGIFIGIYKQSFKNIKIPFVPFMLLGIIIAFFSNFEIFNFISSQKL